MDDRRRDGGTNSTLRTKEQGTHLTLNEHDVDDDEEVPRKAVTFSPAATTRWVWAVLHAIDLLSPFENFSV